MSAVAFIRRCMASGMDWETALTAAEAFEATVAVLDVGKRLRAGDPGAPASQPEGEVVAVYVLGHDHPSSTIVKVGISKHPERRCAVLEREVERNLYVASTTRPYARRRAMDIERAAHAQLAPWHVEGEWFSCGIETAMEAVRNSGGEIVAMEGAS